MILHVPPRTETVVLLLAKRTAVKWVIKDYLFLPFRFGAFYFIALPIRHLEG
jgi:hypothetical protein